MRIGRLAALVAVLGASFAITTSAAGAGPGAVPLEEARTQYTMTVDGSYTPLVLEGPCASALSILWYAPGAAPDYIWSDLDIASGGGPLGHSSRPVTINGDYRPFVGDFDHNGCSDVFWYAPGPAADYVWFDASASQFTSVRTDVNGTYTPVVVNVSGAGDGADDIFWYGVDGARESIWLGSEVQGRFTPVGAPQVSGTGYRVTSTTSEILFHRPGPGTDYYWNGIAAGASAPKTVIPRRIDGSYEPYTIAGQSVLLYGPGRRADHVVDPAGFQPDTPVTINGFYRIATNRADIIVFHAPGGAEDYLWVLDG